MVRPAAIAPTIMPTVTRIPRMRGLPPMTSVHRDAVELLHVVMIAQYDIVRPGCRSIGSPQEFVAMPIAGDSGRFIVAERPRHFFARDLDVDRLGRRKNEERRRRQGTIAKRIAAEQSPAGRPSLRVRCGPAGARVFAGRLRSGTPPGSPGSASPRYARQDGARHGAA